MLTLYDEFAGWGGSSQGATAVPGVELVLAANHSAPYPAPPPNPHRQRKDTPTVTTPTPQTSTPGTGETAGTAAVQDPAPTIYAANGTLLDPYNLLDHPRPTPGTRHAQDWAARQIETARAEAADRAAVITAAQDLDPTDTSTQATHLRALAASATAHTAHQARAHAWATTAITTDPTLTDRIPPEYLPTTSNDPTSATSAAEAAEAAWAASDLAAAQGITVDNAHLVAGPGMDSAAVYVAMTRGRTRNTAHDLDHALDLDLDHTL